MLKKILKFTSVVFVDKRKALKHGLAHSLDLRFVRQGDKSYIPVLV